MTSISHPLGSAEASSRKEPITGVPATADPAMAAQHQPDVEIHGICAEQFARVRDVFAEHLLNGLDVGASVAVLVDGEAVVDLWAATSTGPTPGPGPVTRS